MKTKLIISANGKDKKGIVSEISSIITNCKGNIETSRMIRLDKEFAMLILVEIDDKYKNKYLLEEAEKINIYKPINYEKEPVQYCGMEINTTPYDFNK